MFFCPFPSLIGTLCTLRLGAAQGGVNREFPGALGCEDRMGIEGPPWSLGSWYLEQERLCFLTRVMGRWGIGSSLPFPRGSGEAVWAKVFCLNVDKMSLKVTSGKELLLARGVEVVC